MKRVDGKKFRLGVMALAAASMFAAAPTMAQDEGGGGGDMASTDGDGGGSDFGFAFSGFIRFDSVFRTDHDENPNNQRTNPFNGVRSRRAGNLPIIDQLENVVNGLPLPPVLNNIFQPTVPQATALLGAIYDLPIVGDALNTTGLLNDTAIRNTPRGHNDWSVNQLRGKFDVSVNFGTNMQLYSSIRTIYDFGNYDNYDPNDVLDYQGRAADPEGFGNGKPKFFEYDDYEDGGDTCLNYLEICGTKYMADFTALYLDITAGPVLFRIGQQQIAWGQALFFRIFDVPNGLDLRRHLILDDALEEYADERASAPGLRVTWQFTDQWEADAFAQMFTPTTYPTPNTPYNVIPSQFSVHETWSDEHRNEDFNYGLRLRANFGNWGLQFIAVQRYNHEGTFRWIESGATEDVPGLVGSGNAVGNTPLEVDPSGVWSANEWFTFAGQVRLNGIEGLNVLVSEFAGTAPPGGYALDGAGAASLLATTVDNKQQAGQELDIFFQLAGGALVGAPGRGGLRGHIIHEYHKEEVYGAGISYVVEAEPGSLLDQLIINIETSYIPERKFTQQGLSRHFVESDESVSDLVMEKYHRWFEDFPATYMVFQSIHKSDSNLFGQHLGCQGGTGAGRGRPASVNPQTKVCGDAKKGGSTDVVFAFLQPFPNYIYRLSGAALLDIDGGLLVQGGFRWSPGNDLTFDIIYNHINGNLYGDANSNALQNIDWADEVFIRAAYQF